MPSPPDDVSKEIMILGCPVRSSGQIFVPWYLMNGFNNFYKTDREYPLAPTNDLTTFWRSKIKGQGHTLVQVCSGEGIHVDADFYGSSS